MASTYRPRTLGGVLVRAAGSRPAVVVTGPRQSGKTTLVRHHFGASHRYLSLDDPLVRELATDDPNLLLARFPPPLLLDEVQYAPELLHTVKLDIDAHRSEPGRYILTGSQLFPLMEGVTESLAGRSSILTLLSLSLGEVMGRTGAELEPDALVDRSWIAETTAAADPTAIAEHIFAGGYPEPALDAAVDARAWQGDYVQTYLERDVRSLRAVGDLASFQRFLALLAARSGGLLNASDLGRDLGVSHHTARAWISVLEASGQVATLTPYFENLGKRLVKRPKVYFLDTGTLAYLLRLRRPDDVLSGPSAGLLFETAVFGQLQRLFAHRGERPPLHFWRTAKGHEVDFVVDLGTRLVPIEARLTATPNRRHAEGVERFQALFGDRAGHGYVVCLCAEPTPLSRTVDAIPLTDL